MFRHRADGGAARLTRPDHRDRCNLYAIKLVHHHRVTGLMDRDAPPMLGTQRPPVLVECRDQILLRDLPALVACLAAGCRANPHHIRPRLARTQIPKLFQIH